MASTTLVAFLFECPAAARTVELLGSWDNFAKPYHLKRDRRRGPTTWAGCYTFEDIICDGDLGNLGNKRNGALKMGGTYWYYYKVDDDEEHHNPSEPSTTICPLLPGQRLNVLEVPSEGRSRSSSDCPDTFTRNPEDKFLTPVPPKPLPSPRLGDLCKETYTVPVHSFGAPRSATYPSTKKSLSPGFERHARSASTSPQISSGPVFADFKGLKEKFAAKRSACHDRGQPLRIGAPTLISTTAEDVNVVPLSSLQIPSTSSSMSTLLTPLSAPPPIAAKMREFSPLGSHPVDPVKDLDLGSARNNFIEEKPTLKRSRSHVQTIRTTKFDLSPVRNRANSSETRRTKHYVFSNEPWLSSPKSRGELETDPKQTTEAPEPVPVLQRPESTLEPPSMDARPSSSHGGERALALRKSPLDKELPALPRYLVPAPLFACNSAQPSPVLQDEHEEAEGDAKLERSPEGVFTWSADSITFSSLASDEDDDGVHSPTFSSLTSDCSEFNSPQHTTSALSDDDQACTDGTRNAVSDNDSAESGVQSSLSASPPQLQELRISTFSSNLLSLDIQRADSAPRRQAACFGLGFQGYSLPEDETTSKATITASSLNSEPAINLGRDSSVGHLEKLMNEFGYLGDSVL